MIDINEITNEEFQTYTTKLVPRLMQLQPWEWIRIDAIAKDVERFIDIVECLYNHGYFVDEQNFLIIELSKDHDRVRLDPMYIRNNDTKTFKIWK